VVVVVDKRMGEREEKKSEKDKSMLYFERFR
jgi:hypothetical protein